MPETLLLKELSNPALQDPSLLKPASCGKHHGAFDYDDTLAFTEETALEVVCDCINELLANSDLRHRLNKAKFIEEFPGMTHPVILRKLRERFAIPPTLPGWQDSDIIDFDHRTNEKVIEVFRSGQLRAAPGVDQLFSGLKEEGSEFCIVSSSPLFRLQACIDGLGHQKFNIPLYSARKFPNGSLAVEQPKPDPAIYNLVTNGNPDNWIAVEDSLSGMSAAVRAGIIKRIGFVGCLDPDKQALRAAELFKAGALLVVSDHFAVLRIFKFFNNRQFDIAIREFGPPGSKSP